MLVTASWYGREVVVEVDEACRSVSALLRVLADSLPEVDAAKVRLEIGGCAADDEAVCSLQEGSVVSVSVTPAVRADSQLREEGCRVDLEGFCVAAEDDDMRLCALYLAAGVQYESGCETPLHWACSNGNLGLARLLIDGGWPLDAQEPIWGMTPLHIACFNERVEVCKLLIDSGCRLHFPDNLGETALDRAVRVDTHSCAVVLCKLLIESGYPLNAHDARDPPLHHAVQAESLELCRVLLDGGCPRNTHDRSGLTALHLAIRANSVPLLTLLLDGGCRIDARSSPLWHRRTPLHLAVHAHAVELCKVLLDRGCPTEQRDDFGEAPLHLAVREKSVELCKVLIDGGCPISLPDGAGRTPLHLAVLAHAVELCKVLLDRGCPTQQRDDFGEAPLHLAVREKSVELCKVLIDGGCPMSLPDGAGRTSLYLAIRTRDEAVINFLTTRNAQQNPVPAEGKSWWRRTWALLAEAL